jgi:hypothetical protein
MVKNLPRILLFNSIPDGTYKAEANSQEKFHSVYCRLPGSSQHLPSICLYGLNKDLVLELPSCLDLLILYRTVRNERHDLLL